MQFFLASVKEQSSEKVVCKEYQATAVWSAGGLLVGDRAVVGGVRRDDSLRVHHLVAGIVELAHLPQAGVVGR